MSFNHGMRAWYRTTVKKPRAAEGATPLETQPLHHHTAARGRAPIDPTDSGRAHANPIVPGRAPWGESRGAPIAPEPLRGRRRKAHR
jgi:hypothetical protein